MSARIRQNRLHLASMVAAALILLPLPALAQLGALSTVPPGRSSEGRRTIEGAPIFMQSGMVLPARQWAFAGYGVYFSGPYDDPPFTDYTQSQVSASAAYGVNDRLTVGAAVSPYITWNYNRTTGSADTYSGLGDAALTGKYRFAGSAESRTQVAGHGYLWLPTGGEEVGTAGVGFGVGAAISHQLERFSLHGAVGSWIPLNERDGSNSIDVHGGIVLPLGDRFWASGELHGYQYIDGGILSMIATPGVRVRANEKVLVDLGFAVPVHTESDFIDTFDYGFALGVNVVP